MFTNKKFGLSDSLIEAAKKVMTKEKKHKEYGVDTERELAAKKSPKKAAEYGVKTEIADPAGSPAGGRITGSMDTKSRKANPTGKKDSVEVNPSLKEMTMKERTAFHMAAASAKRLGKSHFMFSGKKFPVKMSGDVAKQMTSEEAVTEERWVDLKTKKFVQAPTREKAAELLNTLPLYIRKAPMQAENVAEGGMPSSIIRSKQRLERLSDADFAKEHDKKSDDDLRAMAWRYGHGKGSNHYVNKKIRGLKDLEAQKTKSVTEEGKMSDAEVTRAHKIGKHFKKKGIGDEPYALATWLTQKKPGAAKKAEKTIKKED